MSSREGLSAMLPSEHARSIQIRVAEEARLQCRASARREGSRAPETPLIAALFAALLSPK